MCYFRLSATVKEQLVSLLADEKTGSERLSLLPKVTQFAGE
jgi:hypothetical protein